MSIDSIKWDSENDQPTDPEILKSGIVQTRSLAEDLFDGEAVDCMPLSGGRLTVIQYHDGGDITVYETKIVRSGSLLREDYIAEIDA